MYWIFLVINLLNLSDGAILSDHLEWEHLPNLTSVYYISEAYLNYLDALRFCTSHGAQLVSIETKFENLALAHRLQLKGNPENHSYWTSGTDQFQEGKWVWMSTGQPIVFTDWCSFEPSDHKGSENCLQLVGKHSFCWNDAYCRWSSVLPLEFRFICEKTPCS